MDSIRVSGLIIYEHEIVMLGHTSMLNLLMSNKLPKHGLNKKSTQI